MRYHLLNPTGNITALIEGEYPAEEIMKKEPACEQAGYIFPKEGCDIALRMAGGEFCGNATMSAAFLTGKEEAEVFVEGTGTVRVVRKGDRYSVRMPEPLGITELNGLPLVRFKGIDHLIIEGELDSSLIKEYCSGEALGFMYLKGDELKPLVYVKSIDTLFLENSCASGTAAVGEWKKEAVRLREPGGVLEYSGGWLTGTVELIKTVEL